VSRVVAWLEHLDRLPRHDCRYRVLIDKLGMPIATEQNAEIVEPSDDTLQFDPVNQKDCQRYLIFADKIEKSVLEILWPL
jgi:hypothetical protein